MSPYFGQFFDLIKEAHHTGGSELGLAVNLFSLTVGLRASTVVETGRYRGFSALSLASALKLLDDPTWVDGKDFHGRPEVDYVELEKPKTRQLYSIDPMPLHEADVLLTKAGVREYVTFWNCLSEDAPVPPTPIDLLFVDGNHGYEACYVDVMKFSAAMRPGGLIVMHDFFGWYDANGRNGSRVKDVANLLWVNTFKQGIVVDTGYPSFAIFRKPDPKLGF